MKAQIGDHIVIEGTHLADRRRVGVIVKITHADGTPPYLVRWLNDNHETFLIPGPTARVEPTDPAGDDGSPASA